MDASVFLNAVNIRKLYGSNSVLKDVSLRIRKGSIHAILGANGAGKSTLVNIISGVTTLTNGEILIDGVKVEFGSPRDAKRFGIVTMHQELDLMPNLTVWENIMIEKFPNIFGLMNKQKAFRITSEILENQLGVSIPLNAKLKSLTLSQQQLVYLARLLTTNAKLMILDEPSAALGESEQVILHRVIRKLRDQGMAIVLISHKLDEVLSLCDEITVLRDGRVAGAYQQSEATMDTLIESIIGADTKGRISPFTKQPQSNIESECLYEFLNVRTERLKGISLQITPGTVTAVTGLAGAGHEDVPLIVSGVLKPNGGLLKFQGDSAPNSIRRAIKKGIVFVHSDRKSAGIFPNMTINENIMMSRIPRNYGIVNFKQLNNNSAEIVGKLDVFGYGIRKPVKQLSGGNQQKTLIGRWLHTDWNLFVCAEPTRGVDVSGRFDIHNLLRRIVKGQPSKSVLLSSDDVEEMYEVADVIYTFKDGRITGRFDVAKSSLSSIQSSVLGGIHDASAIAYNN